MLDFYVMEQERTAIIEIIRNGKNFGKILKLLNSPKMRRKFIYRTIKRYKDLVEYLTSLDLVAQSLLLLQG